MVLERGAEKSGHVTARWLALTRALRARRARPPEVALQPRAQRA